MKHILCRWFGHPPHDRYSVTQPDGRYLAKCGRCGTDVSHLDLTSRERDGR